MKDFRLALVSHRSIVGGKRRNLKATIEWVGRAAEAGADLVGFPELGLTGHVGHPAMVSEAEPVPDGPCVERLAEVARERRLYVAVGICEEEKGIHYNTQFVVGPDGYVGKQRKLHLSRDEYFFFRPGTRMPVLDLPFVRMGIVICYDNTFPETARCLAVEGAELLFCPHAARFGKWPRGKEGRAAAARANLDSWAVTHRSRGLDNGVYVALCDMVGPYGKGLGVEANHAGGCMVVSPRGEAIARTRGRDIEEAMLVEDLRAEAVAARRRAACFNLQTRRPEIYGALTRPTD
jgi:predicted amidohydrolase